MVSVELFAQGGMVDINNDEYNQVVERLILANFERPSYRANFEPLRESFVEMHTSMSVPGEEYYIARKGISRSDFVQECVEQPPPLALTDHPQADRCAAQNVCRSDMDLRQ